MGYFPEKLVNKRKKTVLGLMSGTSLDGMDAALLEIEGTGRSTKIRLLDFVTCPYDEEFRSILMKAVTGEEGGSRLVCNLNFLIGEFCLKAALEVCRKAKILPGEIDFVGSHGQTVWHQAESVQLGNYPVRGTLQIGEASVIAEGLGCPVVSDFRVRDMAAGGQGAPLVPYTEYLLYQQENKTLALLNIGGIANITLLPAGGGIEDILAFDTGPGNMLIDAAAKILTIKSFDEDGAKAMAGNVRQGLLEKMLDYDREYLTRKPPKSTGRERYNQEFLKQILEWAKPEISENNFANDTLATITQFTVDTIVSGIKNFCKPFPEELYVSGGGVHNRFIMSGLEKLLPDCKIYSGDKLGIPADAKEAVAFAVLANEALHGLCNNAPSATGARHPVVMGKITI